MTEQLKENRLFVGSETLALDDGFLPEGSPWSEEIARAFAADDDLELTEESWEALRLLRELYLQTGQPPHNKVLLNRYAELKGVSRNEATKRFYALFPLGPVAQAARIAGLPKPRRCCT